MNTPRFRPARPTLFLFVSSALFLLLVQANASQSTTGFYFEDVLAKRYGEVPEWTLDAFCPVSSSIVARRVLADYGAMFAAHDSVSLPSVCIQPGEAEARKYQAQLKKETIELRGVPINLQTAAAEKLRLVIAESATGGFSITPLDGRIAGGRTYGDTLMLWNSRVFPGMDFWTRRGRLTEEDRDELTKLNQEEKIAKILEWESEGMFFNLGRNRSILTSTAPPGASQHLSLVALDIVEFWDTDLRSALNRNGWFQTIVDDPPHFTFLGYPETELPARGLRVISKGGHTYWVPNLSPDFGRKPQATD